MKHSFLLFFLFISLIGSLKAAPVRFQDPVQPYDLFKASSLLEVKAGSVSIDQLLKNPASFRFVPTQHELIKPYHRQLGYWLRVDITNETDEDLFLHFVYAGTEYITVYEVADRQVLAVHHFGTLQSEKTYTYLKSNEVCPTQVRRGQTHTFYVYMQGVYTTAWPIFCRSTDNLLNYLHRTDLFYGLYYGFILIIIVYSLILYVRLRETDTLRYAIWVIFMGLQLALFRGHTNEFFWPSNPSIERYATVLAGITGLLHIPFTLSFLRLRQQSPLFYKIGIGIFVLYAIGILINVVAVSLQERAGRQIDIVPQVALLEGIFSISAGVVTYRRGFRPALFYIIGNVVFFASIFVFLVYAAGRLPHSFWTYNSIHIGSGVEIILFTLALTYKVNLLKRQQEEAVREQLRLSEANERLVQEQNVMLESKVEQRTHELNRQKEELQHTLNQLKATQAQLVQREKMASLGELMAGIAHEIQNPLNFVNNFAELSVEMLDELTDELQHDRQEAATSLIDDMKPNLQKIVHHGKRADSIIKSMLEHSRSSSGTKQATDINALADEYLRLAYHGQRAKDKSFNAELVMDLDRNMGTVEVMPQEMARVLLNLYNNAFYAVAEKARQQPTGYQPQVRVSTYRDNGTIDVRVKDNGTGIPRELLNKIFQPFFTTKSTGQGTGLGLSLSYDIITNGHGGQMNVNTEAGLFTEFIISIPVSK
ncbi:C4-dicarboxylate transport sensor protein dctB [Fibrisoma limi BUZ 3]|uniref:histidine kinase n=1 Tax=Fibrisoma limi BUZ 3 TaxID=1185876 RepID=I2GJY2_9BACT|nr:7TM diverse intracellular signaling domain-containing protein [Fibrisoma limi]CCH54207.1 C4-dicarboxylate transport sensor protein dctB [Fibrisoma limi BUZ 3]